MFHRKPTVLPKEKPNGEAPGSLPAQEDQESKGAGVQPRRFGTFQGVFIPSILTILGVIMYLRLGWVVGEAGIALTVAIVTLSTSITFITGLSIAATATNMRVRGGGAYFMVSRSFGLESGAAIGLPLYLAQATGVSFYLAGFAESVHSLLPTVSQPVIGLTALVVITVLAFLSADLALKTQYAIFGVIVASLGSLLLGHPVEANLAGAVTPAPPVAFWVVFAVFFPAVTGIEAGISMSGELKDPRRSLPLGTISAVLSGYVIYLAIPVLLWLYVPREVLRSNPLVMLEVALSPELIYLGIWGATLSSAMGALLGGARTLQALAKDRVVPGFIGHGSGVGQDPRLATLITFAIAGVGLYAGSLDLLAPVLSMFFLTSYGALNSIATLEGLIGNPSWRPTFRTPWRVSLLGAGLCLVAMLMIDAGASLIAISACTAIYLLMQRRRVRTGWSDLRGSILQTLARYSIYHVERIQAAARTWRPNILLFSGVPTARWYLVELADAITHGKGFLTVATLVERESMEEGKVRTMEQSIQDYLTKHYIPALVRVKASEDLTEGVLGLVSDYGLGHIEPNTVMLGETENTERIDDYCRMMRGVHRQRRNLIIVRDTRHNADDLSEKTALDIDVWISNLNNNASLMLVFAYMVQSSPEWFGANLTIKHLAPNEDARRSLKDALGKFVSESRVE
ncbi:MAG: Na-K-Cl cotransporter, partial [Deltaproteobacteria bacterium]|nr:Na-K-Cl cotransporter [Deltaproteobacteria bacterium]